MKNKTSITFLYPSKVIGGAQLLFIRLAKELAKREDVQVSVIDYPGGYLESQLAINGNVNIVPFLDSPVIINKETTIITPLSLLVDLDLLVDFRSIKANLIFWAIHPDNIRYVLYGMGRKWLGNKQAAKLLIKELSDRGHVIYMDKANFLAVKNEIDIDPVSNYVPIPVPTLVHDVVISVHTTPVINIGWLGRITYDKVYSIYKIIDEMKILPSGTKTVLHIIGDGNKINDLIEYLKSAGVDYRMAGVLVDDNLTQYICDNIDLGVAMGTSCMEFALRKTPALIIDCSLEKFPAITKYNWLYETKCYTLGDYVQKAECRNHYFVDILNQLKSDTGIGQRCYDYVIEHHGIYEVAAKLVEHVLNVPCIENSQLSNIQKLLKPTAYRYLYNGSRFCKKIFKNSLLN